MGSLPFVDVKIPPANDHIYPKSHLLKMVFLFFFRWDMLVPWRVYQFQGYPAQEMVFPKDVSEVRQCLISPEPKSQIICYPFGQQEVGVSQEFPTNPVCFCFV